MSNEISAILRLKPNKGKLVYEYNPLYNYRDENTGELKDFQSDKLNFDLSHPVDILPSYTYDGSVNLILNDNKNYPKLINTRFTDLGNNEYEVIDRKGNADTNIYDDDIEFDIDTSLYKKVNKIPRLFFNGTFQGGNLEVGNYHFYFKYTDGDGNDTDFVCESGLVSVFIGETPKNIQSGIEDQNSNKFVKFYLSNIDTSYSFVKVYYTRSSAAYSESIITKAYEIDKKYIVNNGRCDVTITGSETKIDIDISEINQRREYYTTAKTQTICQNRLFLGGLTKAPIDYKELADLSLRFFPKLITEDFNLGLDHNYKTINGSVDWGYYSVTNIYNKVGYWPDEIYRFGIVYILNDGSLSPVFNIRGTLALTQDVDYSNIQLKNGDKRNYILYDESTYVIEGATAELENVKGVVKIKRADEDNNDKIYGINITAQDGVINILKTDLKIQGFFFVRQKRIPTTLCQALTIGIDQQSNLPVPKYTSDPNNENQPSYRLERFLNDDRILTHEYSQRLSKDLSNTVSVKGAFCPDYDVNFPYYNNFFTGENFVFYKENEIKLDKEERHYYENGIVEEQYHNARVKYEGGIIGVQDGRSLVAVNKNKWSALAGYAEEAFRFSYAGIDNKTSYANNLIRGIYGPYLGIAPKQILEANYIITIKIPGYDEGKIKQYMEIRCNDESPFYAISDRISINEFNNGGLNVYRGDCYICQFTHRINRNFQDPEAPNNDSIVKPDTWAENYSVDDVESNANINRGDVNAVQLGEWITFTVRSSRNLGIRALDISQISEASLVGHPRTFYPHDDMNTSGSYKIPEALTYNDGFQKSVSDYWNILVPDVPYLQDKFTNRIAYSDISITNSFKNGFRIFKNGNYRDYNMEYGAITKIIEFFGNIICVFEHGIAKIPVNERAVAGSGSGGDVFINTSNVLPQNPLMLSNQIGSQWKDSIIKTQTYIYGVDTIAKKIWRTNGEKVEIISNFSIQRFLNENISLGEREKTPILGVRNVKSHYNAFKQDVLFTFYDNLKGFEEKAWDICWSELLGKWITFYSWLPSDSENINNIWFTFNRELSKIFSKAQVCLKDSEYANGIVLDQVFWDWTDETETLETDLSVCENKNIVSGTPQSIDILKDPFNNYTKFEINNGKLKFKNVSNFNDEPYYYLNLKIKLNNKIYQSNIIVINNYLLNFDKDAFINNGGDREVALTYEQKNKPFRNYFWKHGQGGIIEAQEKILPCKWYGQTHPFEFEFVVADNPQVQKIFENLQIISNNVAPESFHYEIVGDGYDFSDDKKNMFFRQEATKEFYQFNGSNIVFDERYRDITPQQRDIKDSNIKDKSTIFPLYYSRQDTLNELYDIYKQLTATNKDYNNLSGSEIVFDELLNQFSILMHAKAVDIREGGRIRGNMHYKEDKWDVQINPITFNQKNEIWRNGVPPICPKNTPIPNDVKEDIDFPQSMIEKGYYPNANSFDLTNWTARKETKPRDKFIKIKVRYYNGKDNNLDLVIISALKTLYTISYA